MRTLAILLVVAIASCCASQTPQKGTNYFAVVVNPSGWSIPVHGHALGTESRTFGKGHDVVKAVRYKPLNHFSLPSYYEDEQRALVLRSFYWHARTLYALEYNGARFGYAALAEGEGIGSAGPVYWLDMDGDGNFERINWAPAKSLSFPNGWYKTGTKANWSEGVWPGRTK